MTNRSHNKIAIVGPESTGKSTLTTQLAKHYGSSYVLEYAREYIAKLDRPYTLADIVTISRRQLELEKEKDDSESRFLFCDTTLLVSKIWAEYAFKICPPFISEKWNANDYSLHLLMQVDLPWQFDTQREHPHLRNYFFNWYEQELIAAKANYVIISGSEEVRLKNAIDAVEYYKKVQP